jgi:hypothetical protein
MKPLIFVAVRAPIDVQADGASSDWYSGGGSVAADGTSQGALRCYATSTTDETPGEAVPAVRARAYRIQRNGDYATRQFAVKLDPGPSGPGTIFCDYTTSSRAESAVISLQDIQDAFGPRLHIDVTPRPPDGNVTTQPPTPPPEDDSVAGDDAGPGDDNDGGDGGTATLQSDDGGCGDGGGDDACP